MPGASATPSPAMSTTPLPSLCGTTYGHASVLALTGGSIYAGSPRAVLAGMKLAFK